MTDTTPHLVSIPSAEEVLDTLCELTRAVAGNDAIGDDDQLWASYSRAVNVIRRIAATTTNI